MPRLFAAVEIPQETAVELEFLRGGVDGARWIDRENYHITVRFIGDVDGHTADAVCTAFDNVDADAFTLELTGVGAFGGDKPRTIWAGVAANPGLSHLHSSVEGACRRAGLAPESRKFSPHVTLARLRNGGGAQSVQRFITRNNLYRSRPFPVDRFVLMSSRPSRGGGPYVVEEEFPLRSAM
jgi:2'-5' RNA ligase